MTTNAPPEYTPNEHPITIKFTRSEFKEFVLETSQTPSEERRTFNIGFDVTRDDIKRFVEKLSYLIATNNNLLSSEFSASIYMSKTKIRKINSTSDFFNIENYPSEFSEAISITLSYFVFFARNDGLNIPEKQIVNLRFMGGEKGSVDVTIRSTEFSWPESIFSHISADIDALRDDVFRKNPISGSSFLKFHKLLPDMADSSTRFMVLITMIMMLGTLLSALAISKEYRNTDAIKDIQVYSQKDKVFVTLPLDSVINSPNIGETITRLQDAEFLKRIFPQDSRFKLLIKGTTESIKQIPLYFWFLLVVICSLAYFNAREMMKLKQNNLGRIWLSAKPIPERDRLPPSGGVLESFIVSMVASVAFALLVSLINSMAS